MLVEIEASNTVMQKNKRQISLLELPENKPTMDVINSWSDWGDCVERYEPGIWKLEYLVERYLKYISDQELVERYEDVYRNFRVFTGVERNTISILSYLSSWYWYRKEYHTRYEFLLRGLSLPIDTPTSRDDKYKPFSESSLNSCDLLFRYGKLNHMKQFINDGEIRISPASKYSEGSSRDPRTDDELNKQRTQYIEGNKIFTLDGDELQLKNGIQWTSSTKSNYFLLSLSTNYESIIFDEFGYDSCVIIKNPKEFKVRLGNALSKYLPDWYFHSNPIGYYDPYEQSVDNEYFSATMTKDFKYAYQMEYRYLWDSFGDDFAKGYITVNLGCLRDICELYIHKEKPQ